MPAVDVPNQLLGFDCWKAHPITSIHCSDVSNTI